MPSRGHIAPELAARYASRVGRSDDPFALLASEKIWVTYQPYLASKGYILRPRYRPGWVRSWQGTTLDPLACEDSLRLVVPNVMDATRASDGKSVVIKMLEADRQHGQNELEILQYLRSDHIQSNPRNHCIGAFDTFRAHDRPNLVFVVMPVLRQVNDVPFSTVGQVVDFVRQLLEGLEFMHEHNLAHRDITLPNIMMHGQGLFSEAPHPNPSYSRTSRDGRRAVQPLPRTDKILQYYFIDYGISALFPNTESRRHVVDAGGRERNVPELASNAPYDAFKADVCILGRFFQREIMPGSRYLTFLGSVADRMTATNPNARITAADARLQLQQLLSQLPGNYLSRPLEPGLAMRIIYALQDQFSFILLRLCILFGCRTHKIRL